jgi:ABC-type sugar transport system substrate-binding protein
MSAVMRVRIVGAGCASLLALSLAACADDDSDGGNAKSGSGTTSQEQIDAAQSAVDAAMSASGLEWNLPTEKFSPGKKRVMVISAGQAAPASARIAQAQVDAAKAMGWEPSQIFDANFSTDANGAFIRQAIEQGYDAIAYQSFDPAAMKGPIEEAIAAGIPVACAMCPNDALPAVLAAHNDYDAQGVLMADWLIASNDGKGSFVGMQDDSFLQVKQRMDVMAEVLAKDCPGCKYEKVPFSVLDLGKPGPPSFSAMLASHPEGTLDAVVTPYDAAAPLFFRTAEQQGRSDFQLNNQDLGSEFYGMMGEGHDNIGASSGAPFSVAAWSSIDRLGRELAGVDAWDSGKLPSVLITKDNLDEFPDAEAVPSDFDYKQVFKDLWAQ